MAASLNPAKFDWSKVDKPDLVFQRFPSRRSVVYGTKGVVSSSNPLATEAGLEILRQGGNAGTEKTPTIVLFRSAVLTRVTNAIVQRTQPLLLPRR